MDKKVEAREYLSGTAPLQPDEPFGKTGVGDPLPQGGHIVRMFTEKVASGNDPGDWPIFDVAKVAEKNGGFDEKVVPLPRNEVGDHADGKSIGMIANLGKYAKVYPILDKADAIAERGREDAAKSLFHGAGNGDDCLAAAGGKGGVRAARPVTDMPEDAGACTRKREYGGNAVRVDDVGAEVADDASQRSPCAYECGNRAKKGKDARGSVKADGRDWKYGAIRRGIGPCRGEGQRKGASR